MWDCFALRPAPRPLRPVPSRGWEENREWGLALWVPDQGRFKGKGAPMTA
ncbi:hypothetical protein HEK616_53680 [Streptomyces nigrescens]|uniref:Uncharacterized protein n=1 Tax=Streptomyces nigrescens TaxID=1920 RepID=A0ABM7ZZU0_STRNI|nr:hypothetical protein HEK616_53680 [Streptomyces nigrescens]